MSILINITIILAYVNNLRHTHQAPMLVIDKQLMDLSYMWSSYMVNNSKFKHSDLPYGENIALFPFDGNDATYVVIKAIDMMYEEHNNYNYTKGGFTAGHFTQLVWKNSKKFGVAAVNKGKWVYITMLFDPPGNVSNQYLSNVSPPISNNSSNNSSNNINSNNTKSITNIKPPYNNTKPTLSTRKPPIPFNRKLALKKPL